MRPTSSCLEEKHRHVAIPSFEDANDQIQRMPILREDEPWFRKHA